MLVGISSATENVLLESFSQSPNSFLSYKNVVIIRHLFWYFGGKELGLVFGFDFLQKMPRQ